MFHWPTRCNLQSSTGAYSVIELTGTGDEGHSDLGQYSRAVGLASKRKTASEKFLQTPVYSSTKIFFLAHISFRILGHTVTLTSPR